MHIARRTYTVLLLEGHSAPSQSSAMLRNKIGLYYLKRRGSVNHRTASSLQLIAQWRLSLSRIFLILSSTVLSAVSPHNPVVALSPVFHVTCH